MQLDIKSFFGSYQKACDESDRLLMSAGDWVAVDRACRESKVGKETPEALYVHISALPALAPVLRVFEGCARFMMGSVEGCDIIKLSRTKPKVSYLSYPDFDENPHPALRFSLSVSFRTYRVKYREYGLRDNPPVLHRKELFVSEDYPRRNVFSRLTSEEELAGLYSDPSKIGMRQGWLAILSARGIRIEGHRLIVGPFDEP
jgi:DNA phosphorothioation-associated putative methyltransferase